MKIETMALGTHIHWLLEIRRNSRECGIEEIHGQQDKQYPGGINRKREGSAKARWQEPDRKSSSSQQPTGLRSELFHHSSCGEGAGPSKQGNPNVSNPMLPRLKPPPYPFQVVARRLVFSALLLLAAHCPLLDICHFPSTVDP